MVEDNKTIPAEVSKYMAELGKKGGATNKAKGTDYFRWVRSHGTKKKEETK